jgi:hypothetical protein
MGAIMVYAFSGQPFLASPDVDSYEADLGRLVPERLKALALLPETLRPIVVRCLSPDPAARPEDAAALRQAIRDTAREVTADGESGAFPAAETSPAPGETTVPDDLPDRTTNRLPALPRARLEFLAGLSIPPVALGRVMTIGRSDGNSIVLQHGTISKRHGRVWYEQGRYRYEDVGSRNGSSLNGRRTHGILELADGDTLALGEVVCRVRIDAGGS